MYSGHSRHLGTNYQRSGLISGGVLIRKLFFGTYSSVLNTSFQGIKIEKLYILLFRIEPFVSFITKIQ